MTFRVPLDFSDVQEFEVTPAGVYSTVVEQLEIIPRKDEEHFRQLKVDYTITEDNELQGKKISRWVSLSPKSLGFLKQWLDPYVDQLDPQTQEAFAAEGFEVDPDTAETDEDGNVSGVILWPNFEGSVALVKVTVERHYQDRTRKVNKVAPADVVKSVPEQAGAPAEAVAAAPTRSAAPARTGARRIS
jgi:hypothetical protein